MADYRSILNRAISALPNNTEETRRTIYDKARNALMRQLSSLEPALSPAEISKQRLQLEEAVRETENQYNDEGMLEDAVTQAVSGASAPVLDHEPNPPVDQATQTAEQRPESRIEQPADKPATPALVDSPIVQAPVIQVPVIQAEPRASESGPDALKPDAPKSEPPLIAANRGPAEASPTPITPVLPPVTAPLAKDDAPKVKPPSPSVSMAPPISPPTASQKIVEEADAAIARVDALRTERNDPLTELKETMAADGVELGDASEFKVSPQDHEDFENDDPARAPSLGIGADDTALAAAQRGKSGGKSLIWILVLLILSGIGAFSWAQSDVLGPIVNPAISKLQTTFTNLFASVVPQQAPANGDASTGNADAPSPFGSAGKSEDRILDTPLETPTPEPAITPEQRTPLPGDPPATPSPEAPRAEAPLVPVTPPVTPPASESGDTPIFTPPGAQTGATPAAPAPVTTPDAGTAATTPSVNIFSASAILYEERKDAGRPDVSTGNIVWELVPTGSEAIGSKGLPSVRGSARIQSRDLKVRVEIMRNLDQSLPASHLIELEFEPGPLFSDDTVNNIAGVLMKQREQDNGQQLAGAVVKVSETVFWIALSARAADLASNVDSIKGQQWFDIPIVFKSGKRAILTLEKSASGQKAVDQAFEAWEK